MPSPIPPQKKILGAVHAWKTDYIAEPTEFTVKGEKFIKTEIKHDGTPDSVLKRVFGFFQDMHRFGWTQWHPGQSANLALFNVCSRRVCGQFQQVGMDKGQGWISMTLMSPMIIKGNSPEHALTLCLVQGEDTNELIKEHFGLYFDAFFPLIEGGVTEPAMATWLDSTPTPLPILPTWKVEVEHDPLEKPEPTKPTRIRKLRRCSTAPSAPTTTSTATATATAATAAHLPAQPLDCWCPEHIFGTSQCQDEWETPVPTVTAKTGAVPQPTVQWRTCSSCRHKFHPLCVPSDAWRCAVCKSSEAGNTAAYAIAADAQNGVITLAQVLQAGAPRCDDNNKAWSAQCFACTQQSQQSPAAPQKLKKGAKWDFCFTLCLDMMADWAVKGMPKTWSQ